MEESIVGILLASCVHTVIAGAQRKEESEWAMALDNVIFRYILITSVSYMVTKNINIPQLEHICKVTIYITDRSYREEVYEVVGRWLKGIHVCSTGLIVKGLALPEMMMEIDVEAMIPEDD